MKQKLPFAFAKAVPAAAGNQVSQLLQKQAGEKLHRNPKNNALLKMRIFQRFILIFANVDTSLFLGSVDSQRSPYCEKQGKADKLKFVTPLFLGSNDSAANLLAAEEAITYIDSELIFCDNKLFAIRFNYKESVCSNPICCKTKPS